jgi:3-oxoacyl-[acyl-carrier-protein] synthase-3
MPTPSTVILGTGSYAPDRILTNEDLAKMVDTSDEWIVARSGIRERRIAAADQATSDLAVLAAKRALEDAGVAASEIDLLVVATVTPDLPMPSTACFVQHKLGIPTTAACFDLNAACSGFIYGLDTACAMIGSGRYKKALVVGAEKLSSIVDWQDRGTCLLFGDGAGRGGHRRERHARDRPHRHEARRPGRGHRPPLHPGRRQPRADHPGIHREGRPLHQDEGQGGLQAGRPGHGGGRPRYFGTTRPRRDSDWARDTPPGQPAHHRRHSPVPRAPVERFFVNVDRYGNTSAASIPIALDEARKAGRIKPGDLTLLVAFGAGLTYGSALIRW